MKDKEEISTKQYIISLVATAIIASGGTYLYLDQKPNATTTSDSQLERVSKLYNEINQNYVGTVDQQALIEGALKGMTDALDDPYSTYLNNEESEALTNSIAGSFEGIGAVLTLKDELPTIAQTPIKDTPAAKAGLKMDDIILQVDGKSVDGQSLDEIVGQVRGEKGTDVILTIQRDKKEFDVTVTRDTIPVTSVYTKLDKENPEIAVIQVTSFDESTAVEFQNAIESMREKGAKSFIIDLRQNPGGLLDQVEKMSSMFLADGKTIVQFADKDGFLGKTVAGSDLDKGFKVSEPTVVLVDEYSASASEIFAAALKESADIPIIGTQTFGKGTVQTVNEFESNDEIKLTVMKWLTPDGAWINEKGVKPTIEAGYPEYASLPPISKTTTYQEGDQSDQVETINDFLNALGYDISGDKYTEKTTAAVKEIQTNASLEASGKVTPETAVVLEIELYKLIQANDGAYQTAIEELTK